MDNFIKFREELVVDLQNIIKRVVTLEKTIDDIQMAIIKKMGDYGKDIQNISKELRATQDSFSKVVNPLVDKGRKHKKTEHKKTEEKPTDKDDISSFMR